ncbi:hypothetical protein ACX12E_16985 [Paenibacillus vandeheii]
MKFHIGTTNLEETNEFLRSLWAEIANEFGQCSWYYVPVKGDKKIHLGSIDINENKTLTVILTLSKKDAINDIVFEEYKGSGPLWHEISMIPKKSVLFQRMNAVINRVKDGEVRKQLFESRGVLFSKFNLSSYQGEKFVLRPLGDNETYLSINVNEFDSNQAEGVANIRLDELISFLSVETNSTFTKGSSKYKGENYSRLLQEEEVFQNDGEFIDGLSLINNQLVISEEGKQFIDKFMNHDGRSHDTDLFLQACNHFYEARMMEEEMYNFDFGGSNKLEIAATLYLSALEVVTLIGFKEDKCQSCSQPMYKINARVRDIVKKYIPNYAKDFVRYYDKRSKFLHRGLQINEKRNTDSSVPILDPDDPTGCKFPIQIPITNLREVVSFCMRKFYKDNLI